MMKVGLIEGLIVIMFPTLVVIIACYLSIKYWGKTEEEKKHHS